MPSGRTSETVRGGVVYFVTAPEIQRVKIGRAKDFYSRLSALRSDSPAALETLGTIPGGAATEMFLHRVFVDHLVQGEWFAIVPAIVAVAEGGELPVADDAGIALQDLEISGAVFRRFARIEQALALGHDTPTSVSRASDCTVDEIAEALPLMRAFGFLRGSRSPSTKIVAIAA